jgi:hypothetical protein
MCTTSGLLAVEHLLQVGVAVRDVEPLAEGLEALGVHVAAGHAGAAGDQVIGFGMAGGPGAAAKKGALVAHRHLLVGRHGCRRQELRPPA